jgi:hypothetical protein
LWYPACAERAEKEVGRLPSFERRLGLVLHLDNRMRNEFDVLAGLLLERGDDLRERLVLAGVEPLLPPHHEVGAPGAERRWEKHGGKDDGANWRHGWSQSIRGSILPTIAPIVPVAKNLARPVCYGEDAMSQSGRKSGSRVCSRE